MGFFDKTDNSITVNYFKQFSRRRDCEIFFASGLPVEHQSQWTAPKLAYWQVISQS